MMKLLFKERVFWHKIFSGLYNSFLFYENQDFTLQFHVDSQTFAIFTKNHEN